ncbi:hypothetical protein ID866_12783 [Astraeus odoratus]|nr:hypothetical protein ID866_12783 [Astraeus odoratus]
MPQVVATPKESTSPQCGWNHQLCRRSISWSTVTGYQSREDSHDLRTYMAEDT